MRAAERAAFFRALGEMLWRAPLVSRRVGHHGLYGVLMVYAAPQGVPAGPRRNALLFIRDFIDHIGSNRRGLDLPQMIERWYDKDDLDHFESLAAASLRQSMRLHRRAEDGRVYTPEATPRGPNSPPSKLPRVNKRARRASEHT